MKLYIFEDVAQLTDNWHSGGGLVVIARDRKSALGMIATKPDIQLNSQDWDDVHTFDVESEEEHMYIFPDAGCC